MKILGAFSNHISKAFTSTSRFLFSNKPSDIFKSIFPPTPRFYTKSKGGYIFQIMTRKEIEELAEKNFDRKIREAAAIAEKKSLAEKYQHRDQNLHR